MSLRNFFSDWIDAIIGSSLFWLTISGMAIRGLKIDFRYLEDKLTSYYYSAESAKFDVTPYIHSFAMRIVRTIFGSNNNSLFIRVFFAALILNIYIINGLYGDYLKNRQEIDGAILAAIEHVDKDMRDIVLDNEKNSAFLKSLARGYVDADDASVEDKNVVHKYHDFIERYNSYLLTNVRLRYYDSLDHLFGKSWSSPGYSHGNASNIGIIILFIIMVFMSATIDYYGIFHAMRLCNDLLISKTINSMEIISLIALFFAAQINYFAFTNGDSYLTTRFIAQSVLIGIGALSILILSIFFISFVIAFIAIMIKIFTMNQVHKNVIINFIFKIIIAIGSFVVLIIFSKLILFISDFDYIAYNLNTTFYIVTQNIKDTWLDVLFVIGSIWRNQNLFSIMAGTMCLSPIFASFKKRVGSGVRL